MPARSIAVQVAIQDADRAIQALRGLGDAGEAGFQKLAANSNQATVALEKLDRGLGQVKSGGHGSVFQQLGYQVGDFAVQVQGGANVLTAFVQQGSQIAGAFGPVGAAVGAVGAIVAGLAGYLFNAGKEAKDTTDILRDILSPGFRDAKIEVDSYAKALEGATGQQKAFAAQVAGLNITSLQKQGEDTTKQFIESGVTEFRQRINPKIPIEPPGLDLNKQLATGETFEFRRQKEITRLSYELAGQLKSALEAGDPDAVLKIVNDSGLTGDAEGAELAKKLVETATKIRAQKELQAISTKGALTDPRVKDDAAFPDPTPNPRLSAIVAGAEARPDFKETDQYKQQEQNAKTAAAAAKVAADAKQRQAAAASNLIAQTELEATSTEKLAAALGISTDAYRREQIEVEKNRKILEASKTLRGAQLEQYKQLAERIAAAQRAQLDLNIAQQRGPNQSSAALRNQAERESLEALDKYKQEQVRKEVSDREQATKEAADREKEILLQPWKDLASATSQITTDIFDQLLDKGKVSGGELAKSLNDTFRRSFAGLAGNLVTQPLQQAIAKIGTGEYSGVGDFATKNPALASVAGSYVAGSAIDAVRGKQTYAALGGAIGAGVGAAVGTIIPGIGTLAGGLVGGALGTLAGSFFSAGGENLGNGNSHQSYTTSSGKIAYSDSKYDPTNRQTTSGILGQVGALQESLKGLGAKFADIALDIQVGNKSGYQLNGVRYGSQEELTTATIKTLLANTSGLSASQQTVLKNTDAKSAQDVLNDLDFAKSYDNLTFSGTAAEKALRDLNEQFTQAMVRAKELGLDTEKLAAAQKKAQDEIKAAAERDRGDFDAKLKDVLAGTEGNSALQSLNDTFDDLIKKAKELGYNEGTLAQIEAKRAAAQQDLIEEYKNRITDTESQIRSSVQGIQSTFSSLIDPLREVANDNGAASPLAQIEQARARYRETLALAQAGDLQGTQQLAGAAQTLQQLSRQYLGSGGLGAEIAREIASGTTSVADKLQQQQTETLASLPAVQRETVASAIKAQVEQTDRLVEQLEKLRQEVRELGGNV